MSGIRLSRGSLSSWVILFVVGMKPVDVRAQGPSASTSIVSDLNNPTETFFQAPSRSKAEIFLSDGFLLLDEPSGATDSRGQPVVSTPLQGESGMLEFDRSVSGTEIVVSDRYSLVDDPSAPVDSASRPLGSTTLHGESEFNPLPSKGASDVDETGLSRVHDPPNKTTIEPWWNAIVASPIRSELSSIPIDLDQLFALTAIHSGRVQAFAQAPWISHMQTEQARAAFDPTVFGDTRFDSISDPVENTLTTGGDSRLQDDIVGIETGIRGRNHSGTTYSIGQRLGHKNSNSNFFLPNNQGSSRIFAELTHPLLRGRKIDVARSLVITAQFQTQVAQADYHDAIQKQLFQVADTYWLLYTERASLLQRRRHLERAREILSLLEHREAYDSTHIQILLARTAVNRRNAEISETHTRILNLEGRLRELTNAPELSSGSAQEYLPVQIARLLPIHFEPQGEVQQAIEQRPEVKKLQSRMNAARTRLRLARDQTKPTLNVVAEGYVAGLQGDSDIIGAWGDQFSTGRPGYAAGIVYERPLGNREANAAVRQWKYEIAQLHHLTVAAKGTVRTEVENAIRNVVAARKLAHLRRESQTTAAAVVDELNDRWVSLGNDARLGQLKLDEILRSHDRLLEEEQNLLGALVQYNRALLEVQRATGKLVQFAQ